MFVVAIIFGLVLLVGVIGLIVARGKDEYEAIGPKGIFGIVAAVGLIGVIAFTIASSLWRQDVGQSSVLKDWGGNIVGTESTQGFHSKAPWVDVVTFDVRNQRVVYTGGASEGDNSGGAADGPQITVQDGDGVTSNIDIAITYSISPDAVQDIYSQYLNEEGLKTKLIFNDVRSIVRTVPSQFSTLELLTSREEIANAIREKLEEKWKYDGIIVNDVALQEIRVPDNVRDAYSIAAQAKIDLETAQSALEKAEIDAQQKVANATAEAEANAILAASLTDSVLKQRYLDTLSTLAASGNVVVVPDGFGGIVNVGK